MQYGDFMTDPLGQVITFFFQFTLQPDWEGRKSLGARRVESIVTVEPGRYVVIEYDHSFRGWIIAGVDGCQYFLSVERFEAGMAGQTMTVDLTGKKWLEFLKGEEQFREAADHLLRLIGRTELSGALMVVETSCSGVRR